MLMVRDICEWMDEHAPPRLAEDWDNVGLLVGDPAQTVQRVMTCLTVTPASAGEAVDRKADMIVTHHPLPFRALSRLTPETLPGRLLLELIRAGVAVQSPHTGFDSAAWGINQRLAEGLGLLDIRPLVAIADDPQSLGAGRCGRLPSPWQLSEFAARVKQFLDIERLQYVASGPHAIRSAAVACGSAGQFLAATRRADCQVLVTGETNFHTCLEAQAEGIHLLLPGHYASERFAVEYLADLLAKQFSGITVWCSERETDPLKWL